MENIKIVHMSCLGMLCEPPGSNHIRVSGMSKEEYNSQFTFDLNKVTCPKCIEILKKQKILR